MLWCMRARVVHHSCSGHGSPPRLVGPRRLREDPRRARRRACWFVGGKPVESVAPAVLRRSIVLRRGVPVPRALLVRVRVRIGVRVGLGVGVGVGVRGVDSLSLELSCRFFRSSRTVSACSPERSDSLRCSPRSCTRSVLPACGCMCREPSVSKTNWLRAWSGLGLGLGLRLGPGLRLGFGFGFGFGFGSGLIKG